MLPKLIVSQAWAEKEGLSDADIASLVDIDIAGAVPASADDACPRCGNHPVDSAARLLAPEPAPTPERVIGREYVRCLCGTTYCYACLHKIDAHQPIGQASVRALFSRGFVETITVIAEDK